MLKGITPFEVWFGCKPHWLNDQPANIGANQINANRNTESDNEYSLVTDIEAKDVGITAA